MEKIFEDSYGFIQSIVLASVILVAAGYCYMLAAFFKDEK